MGENRPVRDFDRLVALLRTVWIVGWLATDLIARAIGQRSPSLSAGLVALLVFSASIEIPFLVGIAKGRRWGLVGLAILAGLESLGALTYPFVYRHPLTWVNAAFVGVDAALFVFCLARLRQGRRAVRFETIRSPATRFGDTLTGALGAAPSRSLGCSFRP